MKEVVDKYMDGLGYQDTTDFTEDLFRNTWSRGYARWRVLKEVINEQGWDLSTEEGYSKFLNYYRMIFNMSQATDMAFQQMGIEQINDIQTVGKVFQHIWNHIFLVPTEIVEETADRTVLRSQWCGNPAFGPEPFGAKDCVCNFHEYYRLVDGGLTRDLGLGGMIEEANKRGLKEEMEFDMPWMMCRDGDVPYCLYVMKKKGTPDYLLPAFTDREKSYFMEHKIEQSGEKTMAYVSKLLGKTIDEVAFGILLLYVMLDTGSYIPAEATFGEDKAQQMYNKYWLSFLEKWFRDAKFELEVGKVGSIRELADIVLFCQKKKFIPYKLDDQGSRIVLTATIDPFAEVAIQFLGMPVGLGYLNAIAAADDAFVQQIVKDARMEGQSRVSVTKSMVKGDDSNEIIIEAL